MRFIYGEFSRDCVTVHTNPGQRHMRLKGPLVDLSKRVKERAPQCRALVANCAIHPQQANASQLRPIPDMTEIQPESRKPLGCAAKRRNRLWYRGFIPGWHQRQVNIGGRDGTDYRGFELSGKLGKLVCGLRRNLYADEQALLNGGGVRVRLFRLASAIRPSYATTPASGTRQWAYRRPCTLYRNAV